jgi:hypothetical protein
MKKSAYIMISLIIFKNTLNLNAESITLKEMIGILIESDTSTINFEDKKPKIKTIYLLSKRQNIPVNEVVLNKIMDELNLKLIEKITNHLLL